MSMGSLTKQKDCGMMRRDWKKNERFLETEKYNYNEWNEYLYVIEKEESLMLLHENMVN